MSSSSGTHVVRMAVGSALAGEPSSWPASGLKYQPSSHDRPPPASGSSPCRPGAEGEGAAPPRHQADRRGAEQRAPAASPQAPAAFTNGGGSAPARRRPAQLPSPGGAPPPSSARTALQRSTPAVLAPDAGSPGAAHARRCHRLRVSSSRWRSAARPQAPGRACQRLGGHPVAAGPCSRAPVLVAEGQQRLSCCSGAATYSAPRGGEQRHVGEKRRPAAGRRRGWRGSARAPPAGRSSP
jgi:hypothetical protein